MLKKNNEKVENIFTDGMSNFFTKLLLFVFSPNKDNGFDDNLR
ncbi:hypothetical protein JCM19300_2931 [Algibacter lectus]|uniref:Uncharacterized protein n=1 Tax=Algibacter lectus TaxID=221126 RepID=A0A090WW15_9FLAO|nr:hypothetical protein JCM19300_2931 [Algibacter lectus]GAL81181.1 hypothetical protein JCM19274_3925 [Algibacter lectus]